MDIISYDLKWFCKNVRSIFIRNLVSIPVVEVVPSRPYSPSLKIYIVEKNDDDDASKKEITIFNGCEISCTANPSWTLLGIPMDILLYHHSCHELFLRFEENSKALLPSRVIYEYKVDLKEIEQLRSVTLSEYTSLPINSIFFVTNDGTYCIPEVYDSLQSQMTQVSSQSVFQDFMQSTPVNSLSVTSFATSRSSSVTSITNNNSNNNSSKHENIDGNIIYTSTSDDGSDMEDTILEEVPSTDEIERDKFDITNELQAMHRLRMLAEEKLRHVDGLRRIAQKQLLEEENEKLRWAVEEAEQEEAREWREVEGMRALVGHDGISSLREAAQRCTDLAEEVSILRRSCELDYKDVLSNQFLLDARQTKLLYDIQSLYNLRRGVNGEYTIGGLDLPADLHRDDDHISSVLGYVTHVLLLASKYLKIPLRYQLIYQSSRSMIRDPAVGNGTALPLYRVRGSDKDRLDRAVSWLVRSMEQLLKSRGKPFDPRKEILHNLNALFSCELCPKLAF